MKLSNQRGSVDLLYALLCFSFLAMLSFYTLKRIQQWSKVKKNLAQVLCVKKLHIQTTSFIKDINLLNQIIVAENLVQLASLFFPATWLSQNSLSQIRKATQKLQAIRLGAYIYNIGQRMLSGCRLDPRVLRTPYQISLKSVGFDRNPLGTTILRNKEWKYCHPLDYQVICSNYKLPNQFKRESTYETHYFSLPRKL